METINRENFIEHVELLKASCPPTSGFYTIAGFILDNKKNLEFWNQKITIYEMALFTHTSSSSITRFAQKLGLKGFKDLLMVLRSEERIPKSVLTSQVTTNHQFMFHSTAVINEVYENIKLLKRINEDLKVKKRLFFFGVTENLFLMRIIIPIIEEMGIKVYFSNNEDQQEFYLARLQPKDVVVFVSFNFESKIYSDLYAIIKKFNLVSIIVTRNWQARALEGLNPKNVLKLEQISVAEDQPFFLRDSSEISLMFYLKIVFAALLDLKMIK